MIELKSISKDYVDDFGYKINLLKDISFVLPQGKISSIIAPTGSGKSSLLKIIAGLEQPTSGSISLLNDGYISYIPSEPSSFPWLNVRNNILFGLVNVENNQADIIAQKVGLEGYETHLPHNKSLGFRFRVALGRSLIRKPVLIVIDEPFNKMDEATKSEMYILLRKINAEENVTFLISTSNISESLFLSDKIYLMKKNPGEIFDSEDITITSLRDLGLFSSDEFVQYRNKIQHAFKSIDSQHLFNIYV